MKIGLVADAACDLPSYFLNEHGIEILPINLHLGGRTLHDVRDNQVAQGFYKSYMLDKDMQAETSPLSVDEMVDFFKSLVPKYDKVLCVTISRTRGTTHKNAIEAAQIVNHYAQQLGYTRQVGESAGTNSGEAFSIRVIDSQTLFSGEALFVYEAVRALQSGMTYLELIQHIQQLVHYVRSYLIPEDVYYMRMRASKKGDKAVGLIPYLLGVAFNIKPVVRAYMGQSWVVSKVRGYENAIKRVLDEAAEMIERGLAVPVVTMSYAGNPKVIADMEIYQRFLSLANARGVDVKLAIMCSTGGINIGPGAFSMAYASDKL